MTCMVVWIRHTAAVVAIEQNEKNSHLNGAVYKRFRKCTYQIFICFVLILIWVLSAQARVLLQSTKHKQKYFFFLFSNMSVHSIARVHMYLYCFFVRREFRNYRHRNTLTIAGLCRWNKLDKRFIVLNI